MWNVTKSPAGVYSRFKITVNPIRRPLSLKDVRCWNSDSTVSHASHWHKPIRSTRTAAIRALVRALIPMSAYAVLEWMSCHVPLQAYRVQKTPCTQAGAFTFLTAAFTFTDFFPLPCNPVGRFLKCCFLCFFSSSEFFPQATKHIFNSVQISLFICIALLTKDFVTKQLNIYIYKFLL